MKRPVTLRCIIAAVAAFITLTAARGQETGKAQDTLVVTLPTPPPPAPGQPVWDSSSTISGQSATGPAKGLMWKVSSGKKSVYLLGSIHMASSDMYPMPPHVEQAFRNSDVLVVEVDLNKIDQHKLQPLILSKGVYPLNDSLWNHVSPETKNLALQFCNENGFPSQALARVKPWLATVMASTLPMKATGMTPELGIDQHFLNLAGDRMRVVQLETAEWQMRLLADIPESKQEQYLAATLKSSSTSANFVNELKTAWLSGDADRLDSLVSNGWDGASGLQQRIFGDRNPHMADAAENCLKNNQRCFIVVGAGHLVGNDGVVRLLQGRGFKVEQVSTPN